MPMKERFFYICNVFENSVKSQRNIITDSPAANSKVLGICAAVQDAGGCATILSLGRGRSVGSLKRYPATVRKFTNVPIVYVDHWDIPVLTHFVTLISLMVMMFRLTTKGSVLVFYNFQLHYVIALIAGRLFGRRCILDIEDGYRNDDKSLRNILNSILLSVFNACCSGGAMLASSSLKSQTNAACTYVCYGVANLVTQNKDWSLKKIQILLGGSLLRDTGAGLFLETLKLLQAQHPDSLDRLLFVVTGFGDYSALIRDAALGTMGKFLVFKGNVSNDEYKDIMAESHVGLCLKIPTSSMGATTFPSKVIDLAANGLLVVSTRVSDVPSIFDESTAFLLDAASPRFLADVLLEIISRPEKSREIAINGQNKIASLCSKEKIGTDLLHFWRGDYMNYEG